MLHSTNRWMGNSPRIWIISIKNVSSIAKSWDSFKTHFSSEIRFFQYISTNIFFNTIRLRFTKAEKNEAEVRKYAKPFVPARNLSVFRHLCEFFIKKSAEHNLRTLLRFLSLKWSAHLRRSRVVCGCWVENRFVMMCDLTRFAAARRLLPVVSVRLLHHSGTGGRHARVSVECGGIHLLDIRSDSCICCTLVCLGSLKIYSWTNCWLVPINLRRISRGAKSCKRVNYCPIKFNRATEDKRVK